MIMVVGSVPTEKICVVGGRIVDLSEARKRVARVVEQTWRNSYDSEIELLEAWRLIQEELNRKYPTTHTYTKVEPKVTFHCKGQGAQVDICDDCAEDMG